MPEQLYDALINLVAALIGVAAMFVGYYGSFYLKKLTAKAEQELGQAQFDWLKDFIYAMVHSAAQNPALAKYTGEQLKEWVVAMATNKVIELGLPFDENDIDALVEAAVKSFKEETGWSASARLEG